MPGAPGPVVIKANLLALSFVFFPQELFIKETIVRIISIFARKIFARKKEKTDPKVC
jgi:hypothetical protein